MTSDIQPPQDTTIHTLVIDEAYKDDALAQIKKMVKGNKCDPETVTLETFEGEILHFQAENMLTILTKTSHKRVPGRVSGPVAVDNEVAAKSAIANAYHTLSQDRDMERKIRDVVLKRDDQGFGLQDHVPLPFWKKELVIFEPCLTCRTTGSVKCLPCAGKGVDQCVSCHGSGMRHCTHCNGAQMIAGPNGHTIQCPVCHGHGRTSCPSCHQSGTVPCKTCRSKGITPCPNCQGNAWMSHIHLMEIEARTAFDYPRGKLPEKVVAMIEKHGAKIREHADITISQEEMSTVNIDDDQKAKELEDADKNKDYRIPILYEVFLPYGHAEYNINDKTYYTFLFGTQGRLIHASPFLDDLIKNGIRKLSDAAEFRGDIEENLTYAAEYRTVKEGIFYTALYPLGKAKHLLKKANTPGLSDTAIEKIVSYTDTALRHITKKPRNVGLIFSGILNFILFCVYFLSPARGMILSRMQNQDFHFIFDIFVLFSVLYLGIIMIQTLSFAAVKRVMMRIGISKPAVPKLGKRLYWSAGLSVLLFFLVLEISRRMGIAPLWYSALFY